MKLFIIALPNQKTSIGLLSRACEKNKLDYEILDPNVTCPCDINVAKNDMVYRVSDAYHYGCLELEYHLIEKGATSFYKNNSPYLLNLENIDSILLGQSDIATPKTINYLPKDRDAMLKCIDYLGGFPIIIKALGGSHGVGVMKIETTESLFSVSDYLRGQGGIFVMKEYCDVKSTARLIVLGDKVIDSIEYRANKGDFRSNEGTKPNTDVKEYDDATKELAVKATHALGLEFGGVDIMNTPDGPKVAEVNFPCFFPRCQMLTSVDIADEMIKYLIVKTTQKENN